MKQDMSVSLQDVVVRRRGKIVLGPITLDLPNAGFTMVLGPNGAGKTTLLKVLHGVERTSSGWMSWSVPSQTARDGQAYVFQSPIMLRRSVRANLAYPLQLLGLDKADISARVTKWAVRIGLSAALYFPALSLSGGEQQKLALARALIRRPNTLFLDEPCANLDGSSIREIEEILREAVQAGAQIIMTTHDLGQARRLADHVVFLNKGQIEEQASATAFFDAPGSVGASAFLNGDIVE
ncbi:ABC transporter, ATP-binding cassette protein [Planktomarina temperata RCA23]|uniref:ABC transporter, ATP-binding cassette protein n=1 Tax=Planktomarina temperata RCA23 TaxID=666509 RepID=A0AAN0RKF1_9RHOB|nr:ABC transporter, ATP-binding cassette protein [Planktomarina temperata RCA23]